MAVFSREDAREFARRIGQEYAIKVRKIGAKRWAFLSTGGSMNHLRVHAVRFKDQDAAKAFVAANADNNPGYEWQVVGIG